MQERKVLLPANITIKELTNPTLPKDRSAEQNNNSLFEVQDVGRSKDTTKRGSLDILPITISPAIATEVTMAGYIDFKSIVITCVFICHSFYFRYFKTIFLSHIKVWYLGIFLILSSDIRKFLRLKCLQLSQGKIIFRQKTQYYLIVYSPISSKLTFVYNFSVSHNSTSVSNYNISLNHKECC